MAMKKAAGKAKGKASRFKGVSAAGDRVPQLGPGEYILEITSNEVSRERSEYFKLHAKVVEVLDDQSEKGDPGEGDDVLAMLQCLSGASAKPGLSRVKAVSVALAGYEDEASFDEFDTDGLFCEHVLNDGSDGCDADGEAYPDIVGMKVKVRVRRGKPTKDGDDYYRENSWSPVE
jgi:hypothetical protein